MYIDQKNQKDTKLSEQRNWYSTIYYFDFNYWIGYSNILFFI